MQCSSYSHLFADKGGEETREEITHEPTSDNITTISVLAAERKTNKG